jgi:hypothetical protein
MDRSFWEVEQERRKILQDTLTTEYKKENFISEIKNGLGELILKEPNKIQKKRTILFKIKKILGWS